MAVLKTDSDLVPTARSEGDAVIAAIVGDIDLHNSPKLRDVLLELLAREKPKRLVLDVCRVAYMDSSAIAVLVESLRKLKTNGGKLYLVAPQPRVKSVLEIARLNTIFNIVPAEADALK